MNALDPQARAICIKERTIISKHLTPDPTLLSPDEMVDRAQPNRNPESK